VDKRIFGLENEYGVTCTLRGQRRLSPDEVARYLFRRVVSWGRSSNVFLENGARLYLDVGSHPEYATPECDSIADLVAHDKAGERILDHLVTGAEARLREEGIRGVIYLFKNNTDSAGNSYGCHENYLTSRRDDFAHYTEILIPFLVSRQIFAGAGKVLQTAHHQHPRRTPRRRRAVPPSPRHRRRLQHERVRHLLEGRFHQHPAPHAGGPGHGPS
jgi:proteasome accessory factor A